MSWTPITVSATTWSGQTATDVGRQFNTVGSIASGGGNAAFVLSVDESHPIYLSEVVPYITLQEVVSL